MLLNEVRIKGFLSHRGVEDGTPGSWDKPVTLDFRDSPLWLIHGPNGSGKSAIFDALTFALYDRARGRGKGFGDLVNDRCDRAHVEVELEVGGVAYHIARAVSNKGRTLGSRVHRHATPGPQVEAGTEGAVPAWSERTLGLSYENFVCAALLRQGEADAFLRAKPGERKEQLMKLLDLDSYKRLGEAANRRRNRADDRLHSRQAELDACAEVSEADVDAARGSAAEADALLARAQREQEASAARERDAEQAARWAEQIAHKRRQQEEDAGTLSQAARIEADAKRRSELDEALPLLRALWRARAALEGEQQALAQTREELGQAEADLQALATILAQARQAEDEARAGLDSTERALAQAEDGKDAVERDLAGLKRVEELEDQIRQAEATLEPHRATLLQAEEIESGWHRWGELQEALRALCPLLKAQGKKMGATSEPAEAQAALKRADAAFDAAQQEARRREQVLGETAEKAEEASARLSEAQRKHKSLREKLEHRATLDHAAECPTCGTSLHEAGARERLEQQRIAWGREAEALEAEVELEGRQLKERQSQKKSAEAEEKAAREACDQARGEAATARAQFKSAERRLNEAQAEEGEAQGEAGRWASHAAEFGALRREHEALAGASIATRHDLLGQARQAEAKSQAEARVCREQISRLDAWTCEQRRALRERAARVQEEWEGAEAKVEAAERALQAAEQARAHREGEEQELAGQRRQLATRIEEKEPRAKAAASEVERARIALPDAWASDPSADEEEAMQAREGELAGLEDALQQVEELRQAQARVQKLEAEVQTLREQADSLPPAHRVPPEQARQEKQQADDALARAQAARDGAHKTLTEREGQRDARRRCQEKRDHAEREASRAAKLATAFGPGGLQAQVVREAQGRIKDLANDTLDKLSQGAWQIDLRENRSGSELEIIARDLARGGVERSFECLSGGERFRVAISLALAVGQSACGGHAPATLVIDEGFGALDDLNRGLLVSELRRLSHEVLRGGRVIVVSHQDDVCAEFDFRYHVSRGPDGYAQVQRCTPAGEEM